MTEVKNGPSLEDCGSVSFLTGCGLQVLGAGDNDSASEVHEKAEDWLHAGCCEVWLIDPRCKTASICALTGDAVIHQPVDALTSDVLPGFELPVSQIFE